jgi:hypothetical protein
MTDHDPMAGRNDDPMIDLVAMVLDAVRAGDLASATAAVEAIDAAGELRAPDEREVWETVTWADVRAGDVVRCAGDVRTVEAIVKLDWIVGGTSQCGTTFVGVDKRYEFPPDGMIERKGMSGRERFIFDMFTDAGFSPELLNDGMSGGVGDV